MCSGSGLCPPPAFLAIRRSKIANGFGHELTRAFHDPSQSIQRVGSTKGPQPKCRRTRFSESDLIAMAVNLFLRDRACGQPSKPQRCHLRGLPRRAVRQNGLSAGEHAAKPWLAVVRWQFSGA